MVKLIFVFLVLNPVYLFAEINIESLLSTANDKENDYLYLKTPDLAKSLSTITYYQVSTKPDYKLLNSFAKFADLIGKTNGAAVIGGSAYDFDFINISSCEFISEGNLIVFEDRGSKECFYFSFKNRLEFYSLLSLIIDSLNGEKDLNIESKRKAVKSIIAEYANNNQSNELGNAVSRFVDYVFSKLD